MLCYSMRNYDCNGDYTIAKDCWGIKDCVRIVIGYWCWLWYPGDSGMDWDCMIVFGIYENGHNFALVCSNFDGLLVSIPL